MQEVMTIGKVIRRERRAREWTQAKIADLVGTSASVVCLWESGERTVPLASAIELAKVLGFDLNEVTV